MRRIKTYTLSILSLLITTFSFSEELGTNWYTDYDEAVSAASEKHLPLLVNFSGSDWCKPCMLLKSTIFDSERFMNFAKDSLVLCNLDFPRLKENMPEKEVMKKRESLCERYNEKGFFPYVVLLNNKEEVLATTGYLKVSPDEYVQHLKSLLVKYTYSSTNDGGELQQYRETYTLMGSKFEIAVVHSNSELAQKAILAAHDEIVRIEKLISSWDENSETHQININAGIKPVKVSLELYQLIERALKISVLTDGAYDISFASIDKVWKFDRTMTSLPDSAALSQSVAKINYKNVILNKENQTVFLKEEGMKIGFGSIGKGYAGNRCKALMKKMGIENGMVNCGGDLTAWGEKSPGKKWTVGIADPKKEKEFIAYLEVDEMAVVTSGDYERYSIIDGIRYSHIIDPKTGYPATGLKSVTIICPDAELADALATSVFVLGQEKGLALINKMKLIDCILVNDNDELITSDNLNLNLVGEK